MHQTLDLLVDTVGEGRLKLIHANDSKDVVGAHKDRHENIGAGHIGEDPFRALMRHPATEGVPLIIETPGGKEGHAADVERLKKLRDGWLNARTDEEYPLGVYGSCDGQGPATWHWGIAMQHDTRDEQHEQHEQQGRHGHQHRHQHQHEHHDSGTQTVSSRRPLGARARRPGCHGGPATLHCLTGCAIGEMLGMVIGTALGWGNVATMVLGDRPGVRLRLLADAARHPAGRASTSGRRSGWPWPRTPCPSR